MANVENKEVTGIVSNRARVMGFFPNFYLNPSNSDVVLVVGDIKCSAHRFVLAAESPYFQKLLFETHKAGDEIVIDAPTKTFQLLLQYMYGIDVNLKNEELEDLWDLISLAIQYQLEHLSAEVMNLIKAKVCSENVLNVFSMANELQLSEVVSQCLSVMEDEAAEFYDREDFDGLSWEELISILDKKQKNTDEFKVYCAIKKWIESHGEQDVASIVSRIDIGKISDGAILNDLRHSGLFNLNDLFDAMSLRQDYVDVNYVNKGFKVIEGKNGEIIESVLKGDDHVLVVDLGQICLFNNIQMNTKTTHWSSIHVSVDNRNWSKIIDFTKFACYGQMNLHFVLTRARYIKFTSKRGDLRINEFKVFHTSKPEEQIDGFIKDPKYELVTNGKCRALNAPFKFTSLDENYDVKKISLGTRFNIHFNQPYELKACTLQLWNEDGRKQSFVIEAFTENGWEVIFEQKEKVQGLQNISFTPKKISEFRIHGTGTTVGNDFRLFKFCVRHVIRIF